MEILELSLHNFRNFSAKKVLFDRKLTVIIGPNGAGKSNLFEAVSLLCGIRSQKVETDLDLVKFGKNTAKVEGIISESPGRKRLTINFLVQDGRVSKSFFVDNIKRHFTDFLGNLSIVVFHPEDLDLVSGSPSLRRHHMDMVLSGVDREYARNLSSYQKIVSRRNRILFRIREGTSKQNELDFWDERLLSHGKFISSYRSAFIDFLNLPTGEASNLKGLSWELKQSLISEEKLLKNRERDISAGITLSGPHRDDFRFMFRERDLEYFGSRGEQRMGVLALKTAELEFYQVKIGERPILALDDIFSELDWEHREA
ncbi:DNA replication and repair protein RecF, partial [Candidatus Curtissbacteria bacterium]|nr:DNA replication and repair protein RecF [Candidatus Curtissbacteria bacterium]